MPTWLDSTRTIAGFAALADDWDGQDAVAPKSGLVVIAMMFLLDLQAVSDLPPPSRIGACPMGGILFEWQWPESGIYREVEITPEGAIAWMEERKGQPVRHGIGTPDGKIEWKETP